MSVLPESSPPPPQVLINVPWVSVPVRAVSWEHCDKGRAPATLSQRATASSFPPPWTLACQGSNEGVFMATTMVLYQHTMGPKVEKEHYWLQLLNILDQYKSASKKLKIISVWIGNTFTYLKLQTVVRGVLNKCPTHPRPNHPALFPWGNHYYLFLRSPSRDSLNRYKHKHIFHSNGYILLCTLICSLISQRSLHVGKYRRIPFLLTAT